MNVSVKKQIPWLVTIVVVILALRSSVIEPFRIPSTSMLPTIFAGDFLFASKFSYGFRMPFTSIWLSGPKLPKLGDVVIFESPEPGNSVMLIKRVVGLPGDTIETKEKTVYRNGVPLEKLPVEKTDTDALIQSPGFDAEERYSIQKLKVFYESVSEKKYQIIEDESFAPKKDIPAMVIPENQFFVLGDNRDDTRDSRDFGLVPLQNIRGKALVVWLSYRISFRDSKWSFRSERTGKAIR